MSNFHVIAGAGQELAHPGVRRIEIGDLYDALRRGFDDFMEKPSHYIFICLIYPIAGIVFATWTSGANALPLLFPLVSGFALLGPFAAIGLYEISRRRELGLDTSWRHALEVFRSPAIPSIMALGAFLLALFVAWLLLAQGLYQWLYGEEAPQSLTAFIGEVLTTSRGWTMILIGNAIGLAFAVVVLCTTVIAFPLLIDRDVGAWAAIQTSARAVAANPVPMVVWGIIVAVCLAIGSLPLFAGLILVIPILGHATWHLYRRVVETPAAATSKAAQRTRM